MQSLSRIASIARASTSSLAALLVAVTALSSCKKDPIEIIDPETSEGGDFGRSELLATIARFRKTPTSADAYFVFADEVAEMRVRFDKESNGLADRMLAFLAIEPLSANYNLSADAQLEKLGSTVWPSALGPAPRKGENGRVYLERICAEDLASECKFIVPEKWPLFLGAKVWRRFRFRAQESYAYCRECQSDNSYRDVLRRYDELSFPIETLAAERSGEGHPREWPQTDTAGQVWKAGITTLEVSRGGALRLSGNTVSGKSWRERLAAAAGSDDVGLYLRPDLSVSRLREYLRDLGSLGFPVARLQVRLPKYPYELRYLALSTRPRRGVKISARATDTIQVMVLAAASKASGSSVTINVF